MRQGIAAPDIAVLLRGDAGVTALFAQVLAGYGIPVSHDRRVPLGRTRLGAGVLAGARAALERGTAAELLTWLRTPGRLPDPEPADRLEAHVRRNGITQRAGRARGVGDAARAAGADRARPARRGRRRGRRGAARRDRGGGAGDLDGAAPAPRRGARPGGPGRRAGGARPALRLLRAARAGRRRPRPARTAARRDRRARAGAGARAVRAVGQRARRAARRPARDPRAAVPRGVRLRAPGRRGPAPPRAGAVPVGRRSPRARRRHRPAAAAARGRARPRAVAVLRRGVAPRGRALPLLALVGRGGQPGRAVRRSSTTCGRCSTTRSGSSAGRGCSPT